MSSLKESLKTTDAVRYGLAYFFLKFTVISLLLWLPLFMKEELKFDAVLIAYIASAHEVGTIIGGPLLGYISDRSYSKRAPISTIAVISGSFFLVYLTFNHNSISKWAFGFLLFVIGLSLGALSHIISITIPSDLGYQVRDGKIVHKISSITGVIDGIGSLGTAIGQLVIGFTSEELGWRYGYLFVITILTVLTLLPLFNIF